MASEVTDNNETQLNTRIEKFEARLYHVDGELGAVKADLRNQGDSLRRIEQALVNKQPIWNNGTVLALLSLLVSIVIGGGAYLDNQLNHIKDDIAGNEKRIEVLDEFRFGMHYEVGVLHHDGEQKDKRWDHFDELMHQRDDRINDIENNQQYNQGYRDRAAAERPPALRETKYKWGAYGG